MIVLTLAAIAGGIYAAMHMAGSDEIAVRHEASNAEDNGFRHLTLLLTKSRAPSDRIEGTHMPTNKPSFL
jgi:hypothetical protein